MQLNIILMILSIIFPLTIVWFIVCKIMKNVNNNFQKLKETSSHCFFLPINSPKNKRFIILKSYYQKWHRKAANPCNSEAETK